MYLQYIKYFSHNFKSSAHISCLWSVQYLYAEGFKETVRLCSFYKFWTQFCMQDEILLFIIKLFDLKI